ncbi:MAG: hydroxypyruvate isomerase, partial [Pirellulales bacterium]|nr:hydroxypyruvate isomerase [Pirellulales bacterium]
MANQISRRSALQSMAAGTAATTAAALSLGGKAKAADKDAPAKLKGNINHSVCRQCYRGISLEKLCRAAVGMGIKSIELVGPKDWPTLKKYGLTCAMPN